MALSEGVNDVYHRYYYTPNFTSALGGVAPLKRKLWQEKSRAIANNANSWLMSQDPYTLHKPVRTKFLRRKTIVSGRKQQLQMDLIDVRLLKEENDGYSFILTAIDVFSKVSWAKALKNKSAREVAGAIEEILNEYPVPTCQTDRGKEFTNKVVQDLFKRLGVKHFSTRDDTMKAAIVERFNRTLQNAMYRWFTKNGNRRFIDVLPQLVESYNERHHTSIGMAPNAVNSENQEDVWNKLYQDETPPLKKPNLRVGDHVRISKLRSNFERGYTPNWSYENFVVAEKLKTTPVTYSLADLDGETIEGGFYEQELQKVHPAEKYKIEKVLARKRVGRTTYHLIKWLGYPDKFNQWVSEKDISNV